MAYYNGTRQSDAHTFQMPYQEKPPQWVWKVWQEVLWKSSLTWCTDTDTWAIVLLNNPIVPSNGADDGRGLPQDIVTAGHGGRAAKPVQRPAGRL